MDVFISDPSPRVPAGRAIKRIDSWSSSGFSLSSDLQYQQSKYHRTILSNSTRSDLAMLLTTSLSILALFGLSATAQRNPAYGPCDADLTCTGRYYCVYDPYQPECGAACAFCAPISGAEVMCGHGRPPCASGTCSLEATCEDAYCQGICV
jgi:hypothetical protein